MKKYYVRVQLIDYDDKVISIADYSCEEDISPENMTHATNEALRNMISYNNSYKAEVNKSKN